MQTSPRAHQDYPPRADRPASGRIVPDAWESDQRRHAYRLRRVNQRDVEASRLITNARRRYDVYRNKWIAQTAQPPAPLDNLYHAIKQAMLRKMQSAPRLIPEPEMFCRLFQRHLGAHWASRIATCYVHTDEQRRREHHVLYVWRDGEDELWVVDLLSRRLRSIDIAPEYADWDVNPVDFWTLVRSSRSKRWWFYSSS